MEAEEEEEGVVVKDKFGVSVRTQVKEEVQEEVEEEVQEEVQEERVQEGVEAESDVVEQEEADHVSATSRVERMDKARAETTDVESKNPTEADADAVREETELEEEEDHHPFIGPMRQHVGNALNDMVDIVAASAAVNAPKPVDQSEADEMTTPEAQPGAKPEDQSELDKGGLLDIQADATAGRPLFDS